MSSPSTRVAIGGPDLTVEQLVNVARSFAPVVLPDDVRHRLTLGATIVETLLRKRLKVYGLTTGFASMRDVFIEPELAAKLSLNLIRSHASGIGEPFAEDVVRAALLLRAHALARGNSGVSPELVDQLVAVLNARIYPYVPQQGSVGSSGDLAPLSHMMLAVIGDPMGRIHGPRPARPDDAFIAASDRRRTVLGTTSDDDYLAAARTSDFSPIVGPLRDVFLHKIGRSTPYVLKAKEGLAGNNGAVFSAALLALATYDAAQLLAVAELAAALSYEGLQAVPDPLDRHVVQARPHPGHRIAVEAMRTALNGSQLVRVDASCALNMARYNNAVRGLAQLLRDDVIAGGIRSQIASLLEEMLALHTTVWETVARERATRLQVDSAKNLELSACTRATAALQMRWDALLNAPSLPRAVRLKLQKLDSDEMRRVVLPEGNPEVQDNYSFRAAPTILGAAHETVDHAARLVAIEINASTDNPLVLLEPILERFRADTASTAALPAVDAFVGWLENNWAVAADATLSAANFHGEPVGIAADQVGAVLAEVGNIAERRIACLTDSKHSKGLPDYLVWSPGLNSGFMIPQYAAAGLVTENRLMAMPAATDSVPTGAGCEDHVAMSTIAARRCAAVLEGVERIVAIELLCAYQAVQFRKPATLGQRTSKVERVLAAAIQSQILAQTDKHSQRPDLRCESLADLHAALAERTGLPSSVFAEVLPCVVDDIALYPLIETVASLIRRGQLSPATLDQVP